MPGAQRIRITGTNGNDTLTAVQPGRHQLEGLAGDDKLVGGAFNDGLYGGTGRDVLDGGGGDDWLIGGEGADMLIGGTGSDIASYFQSSSGVKVSLVTGHGSGGDAAGDTLTGIENLIGSHFADTLVGDANDNRLDGGRGDDSLYGGGGNDSFRGGEGADVLDGGSGSDTVEYIGSLIGISVDLLAGTASGGHAQGDQLRSIENVYGSMHDDTIVGDGVANVLDGMVGDDMLFGGGGADILYGGPGDDTLEGGAGADVIEGGGRGGGSRRYGQLRHVQQRR